MGTTVVQLRGGKGLTAAEQAYLAGQITEPTQAALDAYLRAPALEGAADGAVQVGAAITELGEATSEKFAEVDDHVALKVGQVDDAITELGEFTSEQSAAIDGKLDQADAAIEQTEAAGQGAIAATAGANAAAAGLLSMSTSFADLLAPGTILDASLPTSTILLGDML